MQVKQTNEERFFAMRKQFLGERYHAERPEQRLRKWLERRNESIDIRREQERIQEVVVSRVDTRRQSPSRTVVPQQASGNHLQLPGFRTEPQESELSPRQLFLQEEERRSRQEQRRRSR